jgi:SAM-dependent methyltransferase
MSDPSANVGPDARMSSILAERLRERVVPTPGDQAYAHLLDLRDALSQALGEATGTWLDYGAGTAPYRGLLPRATLRTADLADSERYRVDLVLDETGRCPVADGTFDGVLSTQVLEHVSDPRAYLAEALRVLRPGGHLVLSTHGVWEDHGGQDLWRWTAEGLAEQVRGAGFEVTGLRRLTCGARAILLLTRRFARDVAWPGHGPVAWTLRAIRLIDRRRPTWFDRYAQRHLRHLGVVEDDREIFYLAVLVTARRPATEPDH